MPKLVRVEARPASKLFVEFDDGVRAEIDLAARLFGPMFEPLKDAEMFGRVALDAFGVPTWPNGADLAPDALYETATSASRRGA